MGPPRKPHRKSRKGCIECKRRHIKCDESQPKCVNCNVSMRQCSYEDLVSEARAFIPASLPKRSRSRPEAERASPLITSPASSPSSNPPAADSPPLNKLHLELFHHFFSHILAFFCLEFNSANMDLTPETCLPMFLFSSILALHMLSEKLVFRTGGFDAFLNEFVQSLRLHRGVRAVTAQSWPLLLKSPLKSLLEAEGNALTRNQDGSGNECAALMDLLDSSDSMNTSVRNTYRETIKHLQSAFDGSHQHPSRFSAVGPVISWPVIIPPRYIDLLEERTPESLIILAYFGALLHLHREMWIFGDSGAYIITSVKDYLGPDWEIWLHWPSEFVQSCAENA